MKRLVVLIASLGFPLAGMPVAGCAFAADSYRLMFKGYSADTLRGVEEYIVEFRLYTGHRRVQDGPQGTVYQYESSAAPGDIVADLGRMFLYLDVDGRIHVDAPRITVTHPDYTEPSPLETAAVPEPVEQAFIDAPAMAVPKARPEPNRTPVALTLSVTTTRGDLPSFGIGENFDVTIELSRDAWLYCFYRQVDGAVVKFFPNPYHKNAKVKGAMPHRIPGDIYPLEMTFTEPPGNELLICYATDRDVLADLPAPLREPDFAPLPPGLDGRLQEFFDGLTDAHVARAKLPIVVQR